MQTSVLPYLPFSRQSSAQQVRQEIIRLVHTGLDFHSLGNELFKLLRTVIPFEVSCLLTADPATLLVTGGMADEPLRAACAQFSVNDLIQDDVNTFASLARGHKTARGLREATRGMMDHSPRYRDLLAPLALGDELRAALITNGSCWGFMSVYRDRLALPFTRAESAFLAGLTPHIALGLRKALLLKSVTEHRLPQEPGILLLADDLSVLASSPTAQSWLAQVGKPDRSSTLALPSVIYYLVARLQAIEQGVQRQPDLPPRVCLQTPSGHWLALHACQMASLDGRGQIAVIFEEARPVEIAPLIVQVYDLTRREGELVQHVSQGLSTVEIAKALHISPNTVQDHLKAIFGKVGVRSRRELIWQLFARHYQPRIAAGRGLDVNGWFV